MLAYEVEHVFPQIFRVSIELLFFKVLQLTVAQKFINIKFESSWLKFNPGLVLNNHIICETMSFNHQSDIDKVLRGLDNVISYHNVASSEDQDIRDGLVGFLLNNESHDKSF